MLLLLLLLILLLSDAIPQRWQNSCSFFSLFHQKHKNGRALYTEQYHLNFMLCLSGFFTFISFSFLFLFNINYMSIFHCLFHKKISKELFNYSWQKKREFLLCRIPQKNSSSSLFVTLFFIY